MKRIYRSSLNPFGYAEPNKWTYLVGFYIDEVRQIGTDPFGLSIVSVSANTHPGASHEWLREHIKPGFQIALCAFLSGCRTTYRADQELYRLHIFETDMYPIEWLQSNPVISSPVDEDTLTIDWQFPAVFRPGPLMVLGV